MPTDEERNHAEKVFERIKRANLGDYHDLYLKTNNMVLDNMVRDCESRTLCHSTYGLDSGNYFT